MLSTEMSYGENVRTLPSLPSLPSHCDHILLLTLLVKANNLCGHCQGVTHNPHPLQRHPPLEIICSKDAHHDVLILPTIVYNGSRTSMPPKQMVYP